MLSTIFALLMLLTWHIANSEKCYYDKGDVIYIDAFEESVHVITLPKERMCLVFSNTLDTPNARVAQLKCEHFTPTDFFNLANLDELKSVWNSYPKIPKNGEWHVKEIPLLTCRTIRNLAYENSSCAYVAGFACQYKFQYNCRWVITPETINRGNAVQYKVQMWQYCDADHDKSCQPVIPTNVVKCPGAEYVFGDEVPCSATCTTITGPPPVKFSPVIFQCRNGNRFVMNYSETCNTEVPCELNATSRITEKSRITDSTRITSSSGITGSSRISGSSLITTSSGITEALRSTSSVRLNFMVVTSGATETGLSVVHIVIISLVLLLLIVALGCIIVWVVTKRRKKKRTTTKSTSSKSRDHDKKHVDGEHVAGSTKPGVKKTVAVGADLSVPGTTRSRDTGARSKSTGESSVSSAPKAADGRKKPKVTKSKSRDSESPTAAGGRKKHRAAPVKKSKSRDKVSKKRLKVRKPKR